MEEQNYEVEILKKSIFFVNSSSEAIFHGLHLIIQKALHRPPEFCANQLKLGPE